MAIEAGLLAVSASENMTPQIMLASVFVGAAVAAALLTHRLVLAVAG